MRVRIWGSLLLAVWCAGCSAAQPPAQLVNAVAPGQAKITITRDPLPPGPPVMVDSIDGPHPAEAPPALIDINETHIGNLAPGQTYVGGVAPGPIAITVTGMMDVGNYILRFDAVAGKTYAFQVSPRTDLSRPLARAALGLTGAVVEAAVMGERGGPFKITQITP
jgi:hypothetical protein